MCLHWYVGREVPLMTGFPIYLALSWDLAMTAAESLTIELVKISHLWQYLRRTKPFRHPDSGQQLHTECPKPLLGNPSISIIVPVKLVTNSENESCQDCMVIALSK